MKPQNKPQRIAKKNGPRSNRRAPNNTTNRPIQGGPRAKPRLFSSAHSAFCYCRSSWYCLLNNFCAASNVKNRRPLATAGGFLNIARQRSAPSGILFKSGSTASTIKNFMIFQIFMKFGLSWGVTCAWLPRDIEKLRTWDLHHSIPYILKYPGKYAESK